MKKKKFILNGLDCANCAAKIEENIKKLKDVEEVELNFITKTLSFEVKDNEKIKEIKEIVKKIEPEIEVYNGL